MHISSTMRILASTLALLGACSTPHAQGQAQVPTTGPDLPTQYATLAAEGPRAPFLPQLMSFKAAPFSASFQTEARQILTDGSTITNTRTGRMARDSAGRTYLELITTRGPAANPSTYTSININDAVTHTHILLLPEAHIARRYLRPAPSADASQLRPVGGRATSPATSGTLGSGPIRSVNPDDLTSRPVRPGTSTSALPPIQKEDLGEDSIDGITVRHYREMQTIPAGEQGNDRDLIITNEFWYSKQLRLNLKAMRSDPRFGEETLSLNELERNEPQASLFEIPADYSVTDVPIGGGAGVAAPVAEAAPSEKP